MSDPESDSQDFQDAVSCDEPVTDEIAFEFKVTRRDLAKYLKAAGYLITNERIDWYLENRVELTDYIMFEINDVFQQGLVDMVSEGLLPPASDRPQ